MRKTRPTRARCLFLAIVFVSWMVASGRAATARPANAHGIAVDANYPGGNIIVDRIDGNTVYLRQDLRDTKGWWFWWNFRVRGAAGRTLRFCFPAPSPIGVRGPAVSLDGGRTWKWLEKTKSASFLATSAASETTSAAKKEADFVFSFGKDSDEVRFAFAVPYQVADLERFLAKHPVSETFHVQTLCQSLHKRPVPILYVGRRRTAADDQPAHRVLITARHHACESMASFVLEGLLDFALSDNPAARWLREHAVIAVVPFVDVDGVEQGDQGKNRRPFDHNRDYCGKSRYPAVRAIRQLGARWSRGKLHVAMDVHCPWIRGPYNEFIYQVGLENPRFTGPRTAFGTILQQQVHNSLPYVARNDLPFGQRWNQRANHKTGEGFAGWASRLEEVQLATTFEIPYANAGGTAVTADRARRFGHDLARALKCYLAANSSNPAWQRRYRVAFRAAGRPVHGVFTRMAMFAPGVGSSSEAGIGALIPWADRLWAVGYVAHIHGQGMGLYEIRDDFRFRRHPAAVTGTFANRMVHWESEQVFIGPHAIDPWGVVRTIEGLTKYRLTATMRHLEDPAGKVYFLTMEGLLFEVDVRTLETKRLANLVTELDLPKDATPHFKGGHTAQGRVVVANNTYEEPEFLGRRSAGRLAQWDGKRWTIVERHPFVEVSGKQNPRVGMKYGNTLFATGWDRCSVILRVLHGGKWTRYRLPKASHSFDHTWNTEWMRIREAQTERYLMDVHGMFYELPPMVYGGRIWGIQPICRHLRIVPDFCHWRGHFVLASDQTDNAVGQPQSGLWFGNIDDLWKMGKPAGWGGPWWKTHVPGNTVSDPFLMTGFDHKVLHLTNDSTYPVRFRVEVDFLGDGTWKEYASLQVPSRGYRHHEFPAGFAAHWVRLRVDRDSVVTAYFVYR